MPRRRLRNIMIGLAALPIAAGSVVGTAQTSLAIGGYQAAHTLTTDEANWMADLTAGHSYAKHVHDQQECQNHLGRQCNFDQWRDMIRDTIRNPTDSFTRGTGGDVYWRTTGTNQLDGMIVILNRFAPDRSTAFLTNYAYYSGQATQGGLANGAAACGVVPPKGKRSTEEESKACTAVAPVSPALDVGSADRSATVDVVGQDGNIAEYDKKSEKWIKDEKGADGNTASVTRITSKNRGSEIYARSLDGQLRRRKGLEGAWEDLGKPTGGVSVMTAPVVETHYSQNGDNHEELTVWVVGADGKLWGRSETVDQGEAKAGAWIPAAPAEGRKIVSAPSVVTYENNQSVRNVYAVDDAGSLRQLYTEDGGGNWKWNDLGNAGAKLVGTPSSYFLMKPDNVEWIYAVDENGSLQGYWLKYVSGQGGHGWSDRGNNGTPLLSNGAPSIGFGGSHSDSSSYVDTHVVDEKGTAQLLSAPNNDPEMKWYDYPGAKLASQVVIEEPTGAGGGRWWGVSEDGNLMTSYDHKKWDSVNHG
ncbi:hypothetical protein IPZ61_03630 [Streptomyces sioyaensis]|uniref:hypothetical protein n=1 Tax=Streptomyces sioyaensis TaxID=67364 RepID=UPI001F27C011|nr:hypothetical protein [Streptomyces sioyaensis]MCF3172417.1 hypothetical protein [Streptomyces sioyaensis]